MTLPRRIAVAIGAAVLGVALGLGARALFAGGADSMWYALLGRVGVQNSFRLVLESPELQPFDFRVIRYYDDGSPGPGRGETLVFDGWAYRSFPGPYGSQGFYVEYRGRRVCISNDFWRVHGGIRYSIRCRSQSRRASCRVYLGGDPAEACPEFDAGN